MHVLNTAKSESIYDGIIIKIEIGAKKKQFSKIVQEMFDYDGIQGKTIFLSSYNRVYHLGATVITLIEQESPVILEIGENIYELASVIDTNLFETMQILPDFEEANIAPNHNITTHTYKAVQFNGKRYCVKLVDNGRK